MATIDFELPQKFIDPKNKEHIKLVAERIQSIRHGCAHRPCPPEIQKDGSVHFPLTNNHWLYPPNTIGGVEKNHWKLLGRYDTDEELALIVKALQLWL